MEDEWIKATDRQPSKEDSPILSWGNDDCSIGNHLKCAALHWLESEEGWNGEGWYDHSDEYGFDQEDIKFWMPLPEPTDKSA